MSRPRGTLAWLTVVVGVGVALRLVGIDRLPGINGDEAWYGVNVNELLHGGTPFLQTPSGNIVNPVHSLPLLLISSVAPPSFTVLRAPEVWWGILTIALAYPLLTRSLGPRSGLLATLLLACSPTAIGYARLGWDPSGGPFFGLLAIASALRDRPLLAAANVAVAYVVHPTNVFVMPFVFACWIPHAQRRYASAGAVLQRRLRAAALASAIVALPVGAFLTVTVARMGRLPSIEMVLERVTSVSVWSEVWLSFVRLISGVTAVAYLAGPMPPGLALLTDLVAVVVLVVAVVALLAPSASTSPSRRHLVGGLLAGLAMFHVIAGPIAIEPGFERYAVPLLVPMIVVMATGLDRLTRKLTVVGAVAVASICVAHAAMVGRGYFQPLLMRGGDAHPTFRTGVVEPKAAAFEYVRSVTTEDDVVAIFAEDWWIYWPVRYLAIPHRNHTFVEMLGNTPPVYPPGAIRPRYPHTPTRVFAIVFHGSGAWAQVNELGPTLFTAVDPIQRPIVNVVELPRDRPLPFASPLPWQTLP